jgi:hypothetical protein
MQLDDLVDGEEGEEPGQASEQPGFRGRNESPPERRDCAPEDRHGASPGECARVAVCIEEKSELVVEEARTDEVTEGLHANSRQCENARDCGQLLFEVVVSGAIEWREGWTPRQPSRCAPQSQLRLHIGRGYTWRTTARTPRQPRSVL